MLKSSSPGSNRGKYKLRGKAKKLGNKFSQKIKILTETSKRKITSVISDDYEVKTLCFSVEIK